MSAFQAEHVGSIPITRFFAQIAQSVEQRTENPRVGGSIPPLGTRSVIREICYGLLLFLRVQDFFYSFLEDYIRPR